MTQPPPTPKSWKAARPFAYHVFPLHLAKDIWREGALLSKRERSKRGVNVSRPTTSAVDVALGFDDVVHFYLPRAVSTFVDLPILEAQLRRSAVPAFPHAVLRVPVTTLPENGFFVCCWNIAVSRPGCPTAGVKGGNWTRGTAADRIRQIWTAFRAENPDRLRARGEWADEMAVPVLRATELDAGQKIMGLPPSGPELLVRRALTLGPEITVTVFSERDEQLLRSLGPTPNGVRVERAAFPGYDGQQPGTAAIYDSIERYVRSGEPVAQSFDRVRPG